MAKKRRRRRSAGSDSLTAKIDGLAGEIKAQFNRQMAERDALDKSLRVLSDHFSRLTGRGLMNGVGEAPIIKRGRPAAQVQERKGRRGTKTAKLVATGQKLHEFLAKDKGTWFGSSRLQEVLGAMPGPAAKAWNKANPEKEIAARGPGRGREYSIK